MLCTTVLTIYLLIKQIGSRKCEVENEWPKWKNKKKAKEKWWKEKGVKTQRGGSMKYPFSLFCLATLPKWMKAQHAEALHWSLNQKSHCQQQHWMGVEESLKQNSHIHAYTHILSTAVNIFRYMSIWILTNVYGYL